jgi:hypothetical protein
LFVPRQRFCAHGPMLPHARTVGHSLPLCWRASIRCHRIGRLTHSMASQLARAQSSYRNRVGIGGRSFKFGPRLKFDSNKRIADPRGSGSNHRYGERMPECPSPARRMEPSALIDKGR